MMDRGDFAEILDEYLRGLEAGHAPDREALLAAHPDLAEELRAALVGIDFVHSVAPRLSPEQDSETLPDGMLGDYRLLRELGRGGMAVVYEAEQVSLGRKVALKVLPFAAVLDPKQLQRFKNEAMAAAHLRHANIVPVYGVGCERGVHYYAMQYVEGQSLAAAIRDMKGGGRSARDGPGTPISSHASNREPAYIRMAAALGAQAAQALDHAHQLGIVHRDVKPGNLLADLAGTLWVTDFGLASSMKDASLTITGELLGTIRYMSPEQALAKRVAVDHRTDVYSLGATLYELFTLEPAFPGNDAHLIIQDIAFKEPVLPRRLNPALPRDLETVILKAMSKDPSGRYATAQEMADDLKRYLEDEPVLARRPSLAASAAKWSRRHRGLVAASFVVLLLAIAALVADNFRVGYEQRKTSDALGQAMANLRLARSAVDKFLVEAGIMDLADGPVPPPSRVVLLEAALEFYANLEDGDALNTRGLILHALHRYEETLAVFDRLLASRPGDARALADRGHMLWHLGRPAEALVDLDRSIEIDPDSADAHVLRGNVLDDIVGPAQALADYDRAIRIDPSHGMAHSNRGLALKSLARFAEAVAAHREAIRIQPSDPDRHFNLGTALSAKGDLDDAIVEFHEAIRLEPDHAMAYSNLGVTLMDKGDLGGAIASFREAIRFDPEYASPHDGLGVALRTRGELDEAIREHREAIRLEPELQQAHINLGNALSAKGDFDGAIREYREAVRLEPDDAVPHSNLCLALRTKGDLDGAIREGREAIRLGPDLAEAHGNLGIALAHGDPDGAIRELLEAVRLDPALAEPHYNLGGMLLRKGDPDSAIREYLEAIRLKPGYHEAHSNLGGVLFGEGDVDGAIREFREAIRLEPHAAELHYNLGTVLRTKGDLDGAIAALREAIRLEPGDGLTHNNLALALFDQGDLDGEIASYRDAIRVEPDLALAHSNLGTALRNKGDLDGAIASFREAIRLEPDNAGAQGKLGAALLEKGDPDPALSGEAQPRDALERIDFAESLYGQGRHAESARMYAEAFVEDPSLAEDLVRGHRYDAACSAALAAAPGAADAAEWRGRALEWLRADLAAREKASSGLVALLERWKRDPDLAGVRDRLDEFPEPEREPWRSLWSEVERTSAAARPR